VLGIALRTLEATWRLPGRTRFAPALSLVEDGLVYGSLDNGVGVVLDARTGKDLVDLSGATPTAVNDYGALTILLAVRPGLDLEGRVLHAEVLGHAAAQLAEETAGVGPGEDRQGHPLAARPTTAKPTIGPASTSTGSPSRETPAQTR